MEPRAPSRILVFEPQTITSNSYVAFTLDSTDLPDSGRTKGRPNKYAGPVCCPSMGANRVALSDGPPVGRGRCFKVMMSRQPDRLTDPRLIGTWEPDFERTIADLRKQDPVGPTLQTSVRQVLGNVKVTYTPTSCSTDREGNATKEPYTVVAIDDESVAIRCRDSGREVLRRLHFADADTYWVYLDAPAGMREYFRRVR